MLYFLECSIIIFLSYLVCIESNSKRVAFIRSFIPLYILFYHFSFFLSQGIINYLKFYDTNLPFLLNLFISPALLIKAFPIIYTPVLLHKYFERYSLFSFPMIILFGFIIPVPIDFQFSILFCETFFFQPIISVFGSQVGDTLFVIGLFSFSQICITTFKQKNFSIPRSAIHALSLVFLIFLFSFLLTFFYSKNPIKVSQPKVVLVQPANAYPLNNMPYPDANSLVSNMIHSFLDTSETKPDFVVFPESSFGNTILDCNRMEKSNYTIFDKKISIPYLINIPYSCHNQLYNAMVFLENSNSSIYVKEKLFPFIESFPGPFNNSLQGSKLLFTSNGFSFSTPICHETTDQSRILYLASQSPDFLIESSSDTWFTNDFLSYAHLKTSSLRSIETGLPIIRVTNSGRSGVLHPDGSSLLLPEHRNVFLINEKLVRQFSFFPILRPWIFSFSFCISIVGLFLLWSKRQSIKKG